MKAAPKKIILSADRETGTLHDEWVIRDLTDNIKIEYIRADVVRKWLEDNLYDYAGFDDKRNIVPFDESIFEDFKEYIDKL